MVVVVRHPGSNRQKSSSSEFGSTYDALACKYAHAAPGTHSAALKVCQSKILMTHGIWQTAPTLHPLTLPTWCLGCIASFCVAWLLCFRCCAD